jgi:hypothetical protein
MDAGTSRREFIRRTLFGAGTGHASAGLMIECVKRFDPDTVLTIFLATRPDNGRYEDELLPLARSRKIGVIGMKAIRYGRQARLPATELLRYALSLDGVHTVVVGLDSLNHLNEDAAVASNFKPIDLSFTRTPAVPWPVFSRHGIAPVMSTGGSQVRIEDEGSNNRHGAPGAN